MINLITGRYMDNDSFFLVQPSPLPDTLNGATVGAASEMLPEQLSTA